MASSRKLVHGSTFSGIGAPEIAAEMLGWTNAFHCEINPFGRSVLDYYFPNAESYEDITKTDFSKWRGKIDVLTGGFPCQPFSYAGKRRGSEDDRYLWPFMLRCIQQIRPTWFIGENVSGITTMVFPGQDVKVASGGTIFEQTEYMARDERYVIEEICQQLEDIEYSVQPMLIPACAVGAPHRRDRVFIVAHRNVADTEDDGRMPNDNGKGNDKGRTHDESERRELQPIACGHGDERPTPDPSCSGNRAQTEGDRLDKDRSNRLPQQSQRRDQTKRTDGLSSLQGHTSYTPSQRRREIYEQVQSKLADGAEPFGNGRERNVTSATIADTDSGHDGTRESREFEGKVREERLQERNAVQQPFIADNVRPRMQTYSGLLPNERWRTFPSVSPVYRGNDGFPFNVDDLTIPFNEWKRESLKAYGNAIVPQVMYEIFRGIDEIESNKEDS